MNLVRKILFRGLSVLTVSASANASGADVQREDLE